MGLRRTALGALLTGMLLALAPLPAAAAAEGPEILEPAGQSGVTEGETFTVRGTGCPAGSTVQIEWYGEPVTTTAGENGDFAATLTMPPVDFPDDPPPEVGEFALTVTCEGQSTGIVMVAEEREGGRDDEQGEKDETDGDEQQGTDETDGSGQVPNDETDGAGQVPDGETDGDDGEQVAVVPQGGVQTGPAGLTPTGDPLPVAAIALIALAGAGALAGLTVRLLRHRR